MRLLLSRMWVKVGLAMLALPASLAHAHENGGGFDAVGASMDLSNPEQPMTGVGDMMLARNSPAQDVIGIAQGTAQPVSPI